MNLTFRIRSTKITKQTVYLEGNNPLTTSNVYLNNTKQAGIIHIGTRGVPGTDQIILVIEGDLAAGIDPSGIVLTYDVANDNWANALEPKSVVTFNIPNNVFTLTVTNGGAVNVLQLSYTVNSREINGLFNLN
jgi:hypothetical protein